MENIIPPEKPIKRKMTDNQIALLRAIVATNGGGISPLNGRYPWRSFKGLADRHMIQGKAGEGFRAVHTHIGLDWVRNNPVWPSRL